GVTIGPSPGWMQERLQAAGVRPINNVVDITNFVMLEWGQPLHAYDYHRIRGGTLVARRARPGERLLTLAAERPELELTPEHLVIADAERAVGLAGVIGGADSEVSEGTTAVLLEAANFLPVNIRRTARAFLPRPTEASRRFERGIPPEHTMPAALRAAQLMVELASTDSRPAEIIGPAVDTYPAPRSRPVIRLRPTELERLTGIAYEAQTVSDVFDRLGFMYERPSEETGGDYLVHAPVWRLDLERPADLVEEVARIDGYHKIPTTLMQGAPPVPQPNRPLVWEEAARDVLVGAGFVDVLTYALTSRQRLARFPHMDGRDAAGRLAALVDDRVAPPEPPVQLANPASQDQDVLRTSAIPSILDCLRDNLRHADRDVHLFELGRIYLRQEEGLPEERRVLTLATGAFRAANGEWGRQRNDFYAVKSVLEAVLERMRITGHGYVAVQHPGFHPYQAAAVVLNHRPEAAGRKPVLPEEVLGIIGRVDEETAQAFDLNERCFLVALDFGRLLEEAEAGATRGQEYHPLPRTPAVVEDLSFILPRATPAERLVSSIKRAGAPLVESVVLVDTYEGESIPEGARSLTYAVVYRAPDHTLTSEEVGAVRARIVQAAERQTGARLRG
ncbi:MAG TPA: phenylalanine--tRNA ligase subunit beta, partial [Chloroflexota bacterium]|nr:phenylalanine--tRNA ligase subunit beta [Chloroflexota bacterium]